MKIVLNKSESTLFNNDTSSETPTIEQFDLWVQTVIEYHGEFFQVSIEIVDKNTSRQLNKKYRNIDTPTNILSFPLDLPECIEENLIGDLAICADVVMTEAHMQNKAPTHHWAHLTIHGILHLLGFDHIKEGDAKIMEPIEIKLLAKLNIPNPYD
ncbi:Metal-dependent hydrolase YbeY, involved in rRNA and/or ribosome maturation and assembly [hydrothermal vent metagenome]|uniref:Metal-dependent hydrolase YbeY, involved in rRNA and/or ribosome maturation and assembly n=1 Tax=hydrothermal vent metagenome TaxID=652676 RepID=A0A3B0W6E7_9ZZZZ